MTTVGFADRTALIPLIQPNELPGPVNRTGDKLTASRSFTVHETANENAGATAEMHHRYWSPGGGGRFETSAHVVADAIESIQLIPTDEQAWHAGDVVGNTTSLGGEICVNDRAGYPVACRRMAKFAARWLHEVGLQPIDGVTIRKHGSWPGTTHKQCPAHLNAGDWGVTWADFIAMVKAEFTLLYVVDYRTLWGDPADYDRVKDFGIVVEWRRAATVLGAPTSDEHADSSGCITRHFVGGYVRFDPKTKKCTSYFARATP
jgi:hypothetical protein